MSSIHRQVLSVLEAIHQQMQSTLSDLASQCSQSTVWVGSNDTNWISEIKTYYTATEIVLDIELSNLPVQDLEVQISPETAVIRAKSLVDTVEGFFSSGQLESIIPLPTSVHPETVCTRLHGNTLTLALPKSGKIDRQRISVSLSNSDRLSRVHESIANL